MPYTEPPMGTSGVGSFPVWSGGSLIFFQLFRCRNLDLNRVFSYFLVIGMFSTWGCLNAPYICMPPYVCMSPVCSYTPICSHTSLCICMFSEALHIVGGCKGLPFVLEHFPYTAPAWGFLPFICTTHTQLLVLCASVCFGDISM